MQISNQDLLKEISLKELTELSDLGGSGELNQEVIDDAIMDAMTFIGSFITLPNNPTALLTQVAVRLSICELKRRQDFLKENYENDIKWCESMLLKMASARVKSSNDESDKAPLKSHLRAFKHNSQRLNLKGLNG